MHEGWVRWGWWGGRGRRWLPWRSKPKESPGDQNVWAEELFSDKVCVNTKKAWMFILADGSDQICQFECLKLFTELCTTFRRWHSQWPPFKETRKMRKFVTEFAALLIKKSYSKSWVFKVKISELKVEMNWSLWTLSGTMPSCSFDWLWATRFSPISVATRIVQNRTWCRRNTFEKLTEIQLMKSDEYGWSPSPTKSSS